MSRQKVLCALENRDLCRIFAKAIEGQNFQVILAHDGDQALVAFSESIPDLVVLDISLPRRDGFELVEAFHQASAGTRQAVPVILLSDSRISPHYQDRANSLGVDLLLAKPVPLDRLIEEVARLTKTPTARATKCWRRTNAVEVGANPSP